MNWDYSRGWTRIKADGIKAADPLHPPPLTRHPLRRGTTSRRYEWIMVDVLAVLNRLAILAVIEEIKKYQASSGVNRPTT